MPQTPLQRPKVIVILGQTGTGKSELAVKIAKLVHGEIISADSRQVYKGLNVGTGKIKKEEMKGIPHYLLDVADPKKQFSVAEYTKIATSAMADIVARGKTPIICGGTGFYIDAIVRGMVLPEVPPNKKLRKELDKKTTEQLFTILKKLDLARAKNIDAKNKVRLVRAIEIAKYLGKVPSLKTKPPHFEFIKIGLHLPYEVLEKKVQKRVRGMFKGGLLNEIKKLKKAGVSDKRLKEFGFEYDQPTEKVVINETIKYAKRQMTWFKRDKEIQWFKPTEYSKIKKTVVDFVGNK